VCVCVCVGEGGYICHPWCRADCLVYFAVIVLSVQTTFTVIVHTSVSGHIVCTNSSLSSCHLQQSPTAGLTPPSPIMAVARFEIITEHPGSCKWERGLL